MLVARMVRDVPPVPDTHCMNPPQVSYPVVLSAESPALRWRHAN